MSEEKQIVKQWDNLMRSIYDDKPFFLVYSIKKEDWGYNLMVTIPTGRTFNELEKLEEAIKVFFPCNVVIEIRKLTSLANVKLVMQDFSEKDYEPIKLEPYEIFLGYDAFGDPIVVNQNRFPNVLIAGSVGSGKSRLLFIILTNLIFNNNADIYLVQIRKRDFKKFKPFSKGYAETEEEAAILYNQIRKEINRRIEYLDTNGYENIEECKKMRYWYVLGDEVSFFMPDSTDDANIAKYKSICLSRMKELIKSARAVGIFLIIGLQRTTADELLPIIKSQCRTKISFNQTNEISSRNIIETNDAYMLPNREFILLTDKLQRCKTPFMDKNIINQYISLPNNKTSLESSTMAELTINSVTTVTNPIKYEKYCENLTGKNKNKPEQPQSKKRGEMKC